MKGKVRDAITKAKALPKAPKRSTFSLCAVAHRLLLEERQDRLDQGLPFCSLNDIINEMILEHLGKRKSHG